MDRIAVCGTVDPGSIPGRRTSLGGMHRKIVGIPMLAEGWPSGLWRAPRKRVGESPQRFKSSTLRQRVFN